MNIVETVRLTKKFGDFVANNAISISVQSQEIRCIVGENGAGKTTLMNMLYGLLKPTSGEIFVKGKKVVFHSPADAISGGLGMVHQHFKLVPSLTIYENVLLGNEIVKSRFLINKKKEIESVRELIEKYKFDLDPLAKIEDLSIGERQRVEILKMLCRNVDILIFDEPTAVLTPQEVDKFIDSLKELRSNGKTIIVITHKLREVMELADHITVIRHGKVIGTVGKAETTETELAQMMVGRKVTLDVANHHKKIGDQKEIYRVNNLSVMNSYGRKVLRDISFSVKKGEIVGIAGVEGNGQSELIDSLTGLMGVKQGQIFLEDQEVTNFWPDQCRRNKIGIIPEDRFSQGLCATMTVADNSIAGYHRNQSIRHWSLLDYRKINALRDNYIEQYDIRVGNRNGEVGQLSGGNAQKLIIARELENKPVLLIACQPTRGVDIGSIEYIHTKIVHYRDSGNGVLLISSELSEIMALSDRILVMYKGKIVGCVNPEETSQEQIGLLMAGIYDEQGG
ncbi:ABC transporter ATP-binding protein [Sporolactobacillus shoreae]|uniref:ABC transporter ATP-binding protein n=1 Tax=Sporolactobacillus shoreae TaxID=1465501 RepID=A0A4Z0GUH6_9BACL|nr:ABC transporter ATP-binding protein [Sporolactobacillus shoreae]TGA99918.1 ABC transporter ATP-binding protein [Sporolactobacillus shoreae]